MTCDVCETTDVVSADLITELSTKIHDTRFELVEKPGSEEKVWVCPTCFIKYSTTKEQAEQKRISTIQSVLQKKAKGAS
jgi:hypothetical protein